LNFLPDIFFREEGMFRNLAAAIVSVCAVSTGSPAWSQNSPVEPTAK
jgi:hypothetical protein